MPWHVVPDHSECPASKPHAVVKDDTDEVVGCHRSQASAKMQIAIMRDAEDESD